PFQLTLRALLCSGAMLFTVVTTLQAGSATWTLSPTNNSWGTASNWTPATIPNGSSDVATFDVSNTTAIDIDIVVKLNSSVFNPGASSFTFTALETSLTISGLGIINNSGVTQNFANTFGSCTFIGTASTVTLISRSMECSALRRVRAPAVRRSPITRLCRAQITV